MTVVNIFLHDAAQNWERGDSVIFSAPAFRAGKDGSIITTAPVRVPIKPDGTASIDLAPGPIDVQFKCRAIKDDRPKRGNVPESGPVGIWDVIAEALEG